MVTKNIEIMNYKYTHKRQNTHPHQLHFEILSELGLIGYFLFTLFFISLFLIV